MANIHGDEAVGREMLLGLARWRIWTTWSLDCELIAFWEKGQVYSPLTFTDNVLATDQHIVLKRNHRILLPNSFLVEYRVKQIESDIFRSHCSIQLEISAQFGHSDGDRHTNMLANALFAEWQRLQYRSILNFETEPRLLLFAVFSITTQFFVLFV